MGALVNSELGWGSGSVEPVEPAVATPLLFSVFWKMALQCNIWSSHFVSLACLYSHTSQVSRPRRESHVFASCLTLTRPKSSFSRL